jgi:heme/copper-type cytochrome/quinol oxidase subunit 2
MNEVPAATGAPTTHEVPVGSVPSVGQPYQAGAQPQPQPQAQERERAFAITSFVLGIASVVSGWTFIAPIVGLIFGVLALRRGTSERTLALWGVWLNIAMLALTVIAVFAILVFGGFAMLASAPFFVS